MTASAWADDTLTMADAGRALGVSRQRIARLIDEGRLPAVLGVGACRKVATSTVRQVQREQSVYQHLVEREENDT